MKKKIKLNLTFGGYTGFYMEKVIDSTDYRRFIIHSKRKKNIYFQYFDENEGVLFYREISKSEYMKKNPDYKPKTK